MKKGFLLTKPAPKTASTSSTTQVTPTSILKSIPFNRFHDVIVDYISRLIKRNPETLFGLLLHSDPDAIDGFLDKYEDQVVPEEKLKQHIPEYQCFPFIAQFLATFLNIFLLNDEHQEIFLMDSKFRRALEIARSLDDADDILVSTPPRNVTPIPVMPLTKSQKRSAKKKARKEKQKLQLKTPSGLDEQVVPTFSTESPEYTPSKPSGSRTVTFNQSILSPLSTPYKKQLKRDSKPQSTPIDNRKKIKQNEIDNSLKNGNVIITGYIPQDHEQAQLLDLVVYDIPAKWDNYTLLANLGRWDKVISVSTRVHKKYLSARVRLIPDHKCLKYYNGGDWTVNLGGIPVRCGIKSFKIVKEVDGSRKLIGYFDTWDHVSTRINNSQLWNDVRISWCRYSTPNFKNLRRPARISNAEKSFRTPKGSNSSFSGFNTNNRKNDQNKTPKSGRSTKKIDHSRTAQSKKPDVKHLITGLKALLEHYV
ncbi:hypothetical protein RclHR1_31760001 [Rhizophagus clarus]|uniref:Uncharacterized protein n=1 Tax=Rhizophagus clarus TaxID=94130 RepID=A0A2Z6S2K6_9GLOM|nr:hypothetical protein RclHR1_31760001 [Rhizophagus clarus]